MRPRIDGYAVPGSLLDAVAREYAGIGDYAQAYAVALRASAARDQTHSQEATNRAIAMQVQYQTERAETEGAHHRQLAAAEAQRAEVLLQTSATLEHLSAIGQEITTHLDAAAVFRALDRHVHGLLDATHFSIFMIEPDGRSLRCTFGIEAGQPLPATQLELSDAHANSARCVRERREILVEIDADDSTPNLIPGTLTTLSLLFAPLLIGERVLGVMTVQSLAPRAYGERERLIFRTLCAYGAIALDNADAYRQVAATLKALRTTQAQLVEKNLELEGAYKALEDVSLTDQLTGLRNRRFFLQHVDADVGLSMRSYDETKRPALAGRDIAAARPGVLHGRHRPLQGSQRPARPRQRRRGAGADAGTPARSVPRIRLRDPLGRRGIPGAGARNLPRRRQPGGRTHPQRGRQPRLRTAGRHPPEEDLFDRLCLLPVPAIAAAPDVVVGGGRAGRPGPVPGQALGTQRVGGDLQHAGNAARMACSSA